MKPSSIGVKDCCHSAEPSSPKTPTAGPQTGSCCGAGREDDTAPGIAPVTGLGERTWLWLAIALVLAGQSMMFGLGWNLYVDEVGSAAIARARMGETGYWVLHGLLFASACGVLVILGRPLLREFLSACRQRRISVEALFLLSVVGALVGSLVSTITGTGAVYYEVVAIVLAIYTIGKSIGRLTRAQAVNEASRMRNDLDWATVVTCCGNRKTVPLEELPDDASVAIAPGESFTVDGVVTEGEGFVRETALTGEPAPVVKRTGDRVFAGTVSLDGSFRVEVRAGKGERKLDAVLATVENARLAPGRLQEQADRLMQWFVPFAAGISILTFLGWLFVAPWHEALFNSMAVLLVACPCALGLATPIAVFTGLMQLSRLGLVTRTGEFLDSLARADFFVFDKTGTLSLDDLHIVDFLTTEDTGLTRKQIREIITAVESENTHPVANALAQLESPCCAGKWKVRKSQIVPGKGVRATVTGHDGTHEVLIGLSDLMPNAARAILERMANSSPAHTEGKRIVCASIDGQPAAVALLGEEMREGAAEIFSELQAMGIRATVLTGDPRPDTRALGDVPVEAGLSPSDKEDRVRTWITQGHEVIFVGDGVNDAGAMALCRASIAMGGGTSLARSTASAVVSGHSLSGLPDAVRVARKVYARLRGNLAFALLYNLIGMSLAAAGILHPVVAALLMAVSSAFVSIRAARAARLDAGDTGHHAPAR